MLLACWKLALPKQVTLLRGNHETTTCTYMYGFRGEIFGKYSKLDAKVSFNVPSLSRCQEAAPAPTSYSCISSLHDMLQESHSRHISPS